jgi:hypothetical protein
MTGDVALRNGWHVPVSRMPIVTAGISIAGLLLYFVFYGITQAATTWGVAEIYLGKPASVGAAWKSSHGPLVALCEGHAAPVLEHPVVARSLPLHVLRRAGSRSPRLGGGAIVAVGIFSFIFGLQLLASGIYAIYAAIRVSLGIPASVIESLGANAAVRRSMALLSERKGRIFLMWLLVVAMSMIVGIVLAPLTFIALRAHGAERYIIQMIQLTGSFLSSMLVGPVAAIALCLFYFDERVRHEGFDIEFLMLRARGAPANPVAEGTTSPEPA